MDNSDIISQLREEGLLEYGSVISGKKLRHTAGIEEIEYPAMKSEIEQQALQELSVVEYIRNKLLNEGKYIRGSRDSYRILLPSENAAQVLSYMKAADRKLKRGLKLNQNTLPEYKINSQDEVRAIMKMNEGKP